MREYLPVATNKAMRTVAGGAILLLFSLVSIVSWAATYVVLDGVAGLTGRIAGLFATQVPTWVAQVESGVWFWALFPALIPPCYFVLGALASTVRSSDLETNRAPSPQYGESKRGNNAPSVPSERLQTAAK